MKILIVDDEPDCCNDLAKFLTRINHEIATAFDGIEAFEKAKNDKYDVIISDVNMPKMNGYELVKSIKKSEIESQIILISGLEEVAESINAIDLGIYDFITKPVDLNKLINLIDKIEEINKSKYHSNYSPSDIFSIIDKKNIMDINEIDITSNYKIYKNKNIDDICIFSKKMSNIFRKLEKLHQYQDIPVLIEGLTGTGKELVAKFIHYEGPNQNESFVAINCAAINKDMFEAELFGYERGAFTGAKPEGREGFIKMAENGTLLMDEITDLSLDTQSKLLRVLQENEFYKVGGTAKQIAKTRFIFATNLNIENLVKKGIFREDLYFRLNLCCIKIPPLNNRKEEIIPLIIYFIKTLDKKLNKKINKIESEALKIMYQYDWPGNIRELKNTIMQSMIFNDTDCIKSSDIKFQYIKDLTVINNFNNKENKKNLNEVISILEADLPEDSFDLDDHIESIIKRTIQKFNGNKTKAAKFLGISRMQLYNRYKKQEKK